MAYPTGTWNSQGLLLRDLTGSPAIFPHRIKMLTQGNRQVVKIEAGEIIGVQIFKMIEAIILMFLE